MTKQTNENDPYFIPLDENEPVELVIDNPQQQDDIDTAEILKNIALRPATNRYLKPLLITVALLFTTVVIWEAIRFFQAVYSWSSFAGTVLALCCITLTVVASMAAATTWKNNQQIKLVSRMRVDAERFIKEKTFGKSTQFLSDLKQLYQDKPQEFLLTKTIKQIPDYSNDAEIITHLSRAFLAELDNEALRRVTKYSKEVGVMVALSPLAFIDMLVVLWRNSTMISEVSQVYGITPTMIGKITLLKLMMKHIALAGVTELASDMLIDEASTGLTGVLSAKLAQGLGVGSYTLKVGLQAMAACRPIDYLDGAPKTSFINQTLLNTIKQKLTNA